MTSQRRAFWGVLLGCMGMGRQAHALDLQLIPPAPTLDGTTARFSTELVDASPSAEVRWDFGDGTQTEFVASATTVEHGYETTGHYTVTVLVQDEGSFASASFVHAVYAPPTEHPALTSTNLLLDKERNLVVAANQDNATISLVDATSLEKVDEIPVFETPVAMAFAPDGKIWVAHRDVYAVSMVDLDSRAMVDFFRLPYASQPTAIVFGPKGEAYLTLYALGDVVRIDGTSHTIDAQKHIAPLARGLTVSGDGASLWVTRFISQADHGEVYRLDPATLETIARSDLALDTDTEDTDHSGRGLPNYLFSVSITPDGRHAWVPSKKDNIVRGLQRDGLPLTQDNAVRPLISVLDLQTNENLFEQQIDLDDRNLPRYVEFTHEGDWAFVSVYGSNLVELRDAFDRSFVTALRADGLSGPTATVLSDDKRLFVLADLSRKLVVFDVAALLSGVDLATNVLAEIHLVEHEKLGAEVLLGKQVFANAEDKRMASEGYLSCDSCHFEGFEDGLVWDFFDRGEGFRNTTSLLSRRGTGQGRLHWSGNFDEIQDFDNPIRTHQGGLGFIDAEKWATGTVSDPLGDSKAGLDADLDALAAYAASLDHVPASPFRNQDGSLTSAAEAGKVIFTDRACDGCHAGPDFTNSADGGLYDVGTMTELSGSRLGEELPGIDTPTLLGVWQTAPYLHDGSAATLRDVLTVRNPNDQHGLTSDLSETGLDQLVAYLQQIDSELPVVELSLPMDNSGAGGSRGPNEPSGGAGNQTGSEAGGTTADGSGGYAAAKPETSDHRGGGCSYDRSGLSVRSAGRSALWLVVALFLLSRTLLSRRRAC